MRTADLKKFQPRNYNFVESQISLLTLPDFFAFFSRTNFSCSFWKSPRKVCTDTHTQTHTRSVEEFACYSGGKCGIKQRFCRNTVMIMLCHVEDISALDNNKSNICSQSTAVLQMQPNLSDKPVKRHALSMMPSIFPSSTVFLML